MPLRDLPLPMFLDTLPKPIFFRVWVLVCPLARIPFGYEFSERLGVLRDPCRAALPLMPDARRSFNGYLTSRKILRLPPAHLPRSTGMIFEESLPWLVSAGLRIEKSNYSAQFLGVPRCRAEGTVELTLRWASSSSRKDSRRIPRGRGESLPRPLPRRRHHPGRLRSDKPSRCAG